RITHHTSRFTFHASRFTFHALHRPSSIAPALGRRRGARRAWRRAGRGTGAIIALHQGLGRVGLPADGPEVGGSARRDGPQAVIARRRVGAGDHTPTAAVPVQD